MSENSLLRQEEGNPLLLTPRIHFFLSFNRASIYIPYWVVKHLENIMFQSPEHMHVALSPHVPACLFLKAASSRLDV